VVQVLTPFNEDKSPEETKNEVSEMPLRGQIKIRVGKR